MQKIIAIFLMFLLSSNIAFAQGLSNDLIKIENISSLQTAQGILQGRSAALESARLDGFKKLCENTYNINFGDLKNKPSDEVISNFILNFDIVQESLSKGIYGAVFNFVFDRRKVEIFLQNQGLIVKEADYSVVIIPLFTKDGEHLIWEARNLWKRSLEEIFAKESQISAIIPIGDISDMNDASIEDVLSGNFAVLKVFLEKYSASDLVIAEAEITPYNVNIILQGVGESLIEEKIFKYDVVSDDLYVVYKQASQDVIAALKNHYIKAKNQKSSINNIDVVLEYDDLSQWVNLKEYITELDVVEKLEIREIRLNNVKFRLYYKDKFAIFAGFLYKKGLELIENGDFWIMKII